MKLATYLKVSGERPSAFGRRIGVKAPTISGWLNDPKRGPSRANLVAIEAATGGLVTAKDFAQGEQCPGPDGSAAHDGVIPQVAA